MLDFRFKKSRTWTDNWGAEDLRVPDYTIPLQEQCNYNDYPTRIKI